MAKQTPVASKAVSSAETSPNAPQPETAPSGSSHLGDLDEVPIVRLCSTEEKTTRLINQATRKIWFMRGDLSFEGTENLSDEYDQWVSAIQAWKEILADADYQLFPQEPGRYPWIQMCGPGELLNALYDQETVAIIWQSFRGLGAVNLHLYFSGEYNNLGKVSQEIYSMNAVGKNIEVVRTLDPYRNVVGKFEVQPEKISRNLGLIVFYVPWFSNDINAAWRNLLDANTRCIEFATWPIDYLPFSEMVASMDPKRKGTRHFELEDILGSLPYRKDRGKTIKGHI